jgi:magnesium chelatase subunit I
VVASANPEDYTRRGRIITPLKDRFQAQIRTHYPETRALEVAVMEQERRRPPAPAVEVHAPQFIGEIVAETTIQARQSPEVNQGSGVSVRASIAGYETLLAAAERRAIRLGEPEGVPRISDLPSLVRTMSGKVELEYAGGERKEGEVVEKLARRAVRTVFDERFNGEELEPIVRAFQQGWKVEVGDDVPSREYLEGLDQIAGLRRAIGKLGEDRSPARTASAVEFILEGLHLSNRLNKEVVGRRVLYR